MLFSKNRLVFLIALFLFLVSAFSLKVSAAWPRTMTVYSVSGETEPQVIPYLSAGHRLFTFDIEETSKVKLKDIGEVYYNFTYDSDSGFRGVQGRITNLGSQIFSYYNGRAYVRRSFELGTCSKDVCQYDQNPHNIEFVTITTTLSGQKFSKDFTILR